MKKALVFAAALALLPLPALSQGMPHSEDRDSSDHRKDRDLEGVLRELGVGTRSGGGGRGASFFLRSGDSTVAVRCDPGDSMRALRGYDPYAARQGASGASAGQQRAAWDDAAGTIAVTRPTWAA
jgi:hypothetical protein